MTCGWIDGRFFIVLGSKTGVFVNRRFPSIAYTKNDSLSSPNVAFYLSGFLVWDFTDQSDFVAIYLECDRISVIFQNV